MYMEKHLSTVLGLLATFVALGGIPVGLSMILDPSGINLGMSTDLLEDSPFGSFYVPGMYLFLLNGILQLAAALLTFRRHRLSGILGIITGLLLLGWICMQVYWIGLVHFLQPLFLAVAIAEIILGLKLLLAGSKGK
jgi:hypothetical protein